ncbi:MAG: ABC transporter permease, partial [Bacteroidota bacterium]|nr:ABC transporter permease [Bacteroidota bacterium]
MILYYCKIALRNIRKQRMFALINIGGFSIGIAACMLIGLFIFNETSYDKSNPNKDNIYRVIGEASNNGNKHTGISFPAPMAKALLNDFPDIEKAGRIMPNALFGGSSNQIRTADQETDTYEDGFCFADSTIPGILNFKMMYGDQEHALSQPRSVILCKTMADKYFPGQNPVGKTLIFNDNTKFPMVIGGVMEDLPSNSHLQYRGFISLTGNRFWEGEQETWNASNYAIYLQLHKGVNITAFDKKITEDILTKYILPTMKTNGVPNPEEQLKGARLYLQPLTDIHLHSYHIEQDNVKHGDIRFIWLFAAIAGFILIMACINFLNLSTARSANRAKEVGLRKVIGSNRAGLIRQFLIESILYSITSFILGLLLAMILLPLFNQMAGKQLSMPWTEGWFIPILLASSLLIGIAAGIYPAFYLSSFKPIQVLKGNLSLGGKHAGFRSSLVVFQFSVSIILLIGTSVIYQQMQYILKSPIGFDKDQVIMLQGTDALKNEVGSFKNELVKSPLIANVSVSDFLPVDGTKRNGNTFWKEGREKTDDGIPGQHWVIDENYLPTMGMKLINGRNFSSSMATDSEATIINKAMADKLGYTDPLGKTITNGGEHLNIIGVVDNFYFESMKQQVRPLVFVLGNSNSMISVRAKGSDMKNVLGFLQDTWKKFIPNQSLRYAFMDQSYAAMYADTQRTGLIFTGFSLLAIIIACLGLFSLAAYMAEQRSKEVSIRKVLGASVLSLFSLLTKHFLQLILLSLCIAIPIGWMLMNHWLQDYVYRIRLSWEIFAYAGCTV